MLCQVVRRSLISLVGLCAFVGVCWLVGSALPDNIGKTLMLAALLCLFPAVFIAIGWVGQGYQPTDPPPGSSRRLNQVEQRDSAKPQAGQGPMGSTGLRRAA